MKTNKVLLAVSLIVSTIALHAAKPTSEPAALSAQEVNDAKTWIADKKNKNKFHFWNNEKTKNSVFISIPAFKSGMMSSTKQTNITLANNSKQEAAAPNLDTKEKIMVAANVPGQMVSEIQVAPGNYYYHIFKPHSANTRLTVWYAVNNNGNVMTKVLPEVKVQDAGKNLSGFYQ